MSSTESSPTDINNIEDNNTGVNNKEVNNKEVDNKEVNNTEVDNKEVNSTEVNNTEVNSTEVDRNKEVNSTEVNNTEVNNTDIESSISNSTLITCPLCPSKIFLPSAALLVNKEIYLHYPYKTIPSTTDISVGEVELNFWKVTSQYSFENIGVTKSMNTDYRYLICADCDYGPLGITLTDKPTLDSVYYISKKRVKEC